MSIPKNSQNPELDKKRHSMAHLMAAAVKDMFPEAQFGVGPVIETGCYYDFILPRTLIPEDLPLIEEKMKSLLKRDLAYKVQELSLEDAILLFEKNNQPLKVELLQDLATRGTTSMSEEERADFDEDLKITVYRIVDEKTGEILFEDLCKGPHVESVKELMGEKDFQNKDENSNILIRTGKVEDATKLLDLNTKAWLVTYPNEEAEISVDDIIEVRAKRRDSQIEKWSESIQERPDDWLIAEIEGKIVGYCFLVKADDYGQIKAIYVDPDYHRVGVGGKLIQRALRMLKGESYIYVEVASYNEKAIKFYEKSGFEFEKQVEDFIFAESKKIPQNRMKFTQKKIEPIGFSLDKFSGSYWRGDQARNIQMQRIYALVFDTVEELLQFQEQREEAKKRDHRFLNETQKYYTISDLVGSGLALFQPKGNTIRKLIQNYLWQIHKNKGYDEVWTPHIAKEALYQTSGHAKHYLDDMFSVYGGTSKENFYLKPMNCPHHMQLFADNQFSYRDMPIRYFEHATVYRDEKTGQLSGLTRVRNITQDDGHLFCRLNQLDQEIDTIVEIIKEFMATFGMSPKWVSLSVRDSNDGWLGTDEMWKIAEEALRKAAVKHEIPYKIVEGEAAFYGPKLDFMFTDVIGRQQQLSTVQIDFNLPERFDLSFTNEQGENERPVVVHRAIGGSAERFMGVMIEQFGGRFPFWLAPTQIKILTINNEPETIDYVAKIKDILGEVVLMKPLKYNELRFEIDDRSESLGKKIREATNQKIPAMLIVGPKDIAAGQVSVRTQSGEEKVSLDRLGEFLQNLS